MVCGKVQCAWSLHAYACAYLCYSRDKLSECRINIVQSKCNLLSVKALFALYYGSINKIRGKWFMNWGMGMLFLKAYVFVVNA